MKKVILLVSIFFSANYAQAQLISSEAVRAGYEMCQKSMQNGYGSQRKQTFCEDMFEMPDPYMLKCVRWVRQGFPSEIDKKACQLFCASNKNWGPWYDFEIPFEDKLIFHEMKRRSLNGLCLEK